MTDGACSGDHVPVQTPTFGIAPPNCPEGTIESDQPSAAAQGPVELAATAPGPVKPLVPRPETAVLPRWSIPGYAVLWALGGGFLWWPIVTGRLFWRARRNPPTIPAALLAITPLFLTASLALALVRGASPTRVIEDAYLVLPWLSLVAAAVIPWRPADARRIAAGVVDLTVVQGVLVAAAVAAYPFGRDWRLPLGMLLPDSVTRRPPLQSWLTERLAFPDYYGGAVIRTGGLFGNPTWAAVLAGIALLVLLCAPRTLGRRWWSWPYAVAAGALCVLVLIYAYSRNAVAAVGVGAVAAATVWLCSRLRPAWRLVCLGTEAAVVIAASATGTLGVLISRVNGERAGSLDSRRAIYAQTVNKINHHVFFLGSGIKEHGTGSLAATLGTHSTLLGLVYRGGWLALWGFVAFVMIVAVQAARSRTGLGFGLVVFLGAWVWAEDLDAGHLAPAGLVLALAQVHAATTTGVPPERRLADELARRWRTGGTDLVTWLNHSSAMAVLSRATGALAPFTVIGLDGTGLRLLLGRSGCSRTSADLVLPLLFPQLRGARVALLGGEPEALKERADRVQRMLGDGSRVVTAVDGFAGRPQGAALDAWVTHHRPDVVIVGMGAPLQEEVAAQIFTRMPRGLVATCGGFMDQLTVDQYYPSWAYPLKLNWAVRLAREPRRLWRRYTIQVPVAVLRRRSLHRLVTGARGYRSCRDFLQSPAD